MADAVAVYDSQTEVLILCVKPDSFSGSEARGVTTLDTVHQYLSRHLPSYIVPDKILTVDKVPVTRHGEFLGHAAVSWDGLVESCLVVIAIVPP